MLQRGTDNSRDNFLPFRSCLPVSHSVSSLKNKDGQGWRGAQELKVLADFAENGVWIPGPKAGGS